MANIMKDMTIAQYVNAIATELNAESKTVEKANGVIRHGIVMKTETNCCPTIYVEEFYEADMSVKDAAKEVEKIAKANTINVDVSRITDYEFVKPLLRARLYNKATKAEVFRKAKDFDDLIIVPYIELSDIGEGRGSGSVRVSAALLNGYNVTKRELIDTAIKNSSEDSTIQSMESVMMSIMTGKEVKPVEEVGINPQMIVLSNRNKCFGAISALILKKRLQSIFPNGYVVLPSSVHEVIVTPYTPGCEDVLNGMVQEVNVSEVQPEEILGSKAYVFAA